MLPILFQIGPLKVYTIGLFLILSLFWGSFLLYKTVKLTSNKEEEVFDGLFVSIIGAILAARVVYVIFNFADFGFNPLKFILINGYPGLSLWGGLVGATATFFLYCNIYKHKFVTLIDHAIPALFLALAFGKLGVFFAGSQVGTPTKFFLSVIYQGYEKTRHITPVYEAIIYFIFTFVSYRILMAIRREKFFSGFNLVFFVLIFSLSNILLDFFRDNNIYFAGQSVNLLISLVVFIFSVGYIIFKFYREIRESMRILRNKITKHGKSTVKKDSAGITRKTSGRSK